jgi:Domain of unknown function (DUF1707)
VTTGLGDERAAAARGRVLASHADREQVIDTLKAAFVQGRLTMDEFDLRVGQTLASRTYAELATLTADIPAGLTTAKPSRKPARARARPPMNARPPMKKKKKKKKKKKVMLGACVAIGPAWPVAILLTDNTYLWVTLLPIMVLYLMGWFVAGAQMLYSRHEKRSGGQLPPRPTPSARGKASQRTASAASAEQLPQINHGQQHTAEAARSRLPSPKLSSSWRRHTTRPSPYPA